MTGVHESGASRVSSSSSDGSGGSSSSGSSGSGGGGSSSSSSSGSGSSDSVGDGAGGQEPVVVHACAGFVAGVLSSVATNPFEIVRTRLQTQDAMAAQAVRLTGLRDGFHSLLTKEGVRGLFRGLLPRCLMNGAASAATFICYEAALRWSTD